MRISFGCWPSSGKRTGNRSRPPAIRRGPQSVEKASQSFAARRRRKKVRSFFRRRVRRKNTLRPVASKCPLYADMRRDTGPKPFLKKVRSHFFDTLRPPAIRRGPASFLFYPVDNGIPQGADAAAFSVSLLTEESLCRGKITAAIGQRRVSSDGGSPPVPEGRHFPVRGHCR